jgi:hypothetical protein
VKVATRRCTVADSIAEALQATNDAAYVQAMDLSTFYLVMGRAPAAASPGSRWAAWENLRRRVPRDVRARFLDHSDVPWWARGEVR